MTMNRDLELEEALKNALRREEAPNSLAAKVLARVARQESDARKKGESLTFFVQPLIRWAAFATVSICLIAGGMYYRNLQRERTEGEAAKQQLMLALRIAGNKLQMAKAKVNEINQSRPERRPETRSPRSRS